MKDLKITIIQTDISWHDKSKNLEHAEALIKENFTSTDLILLPEMFNTGFTMQPEEISEGMTGYTSKFLLRIAHEMNCDIAASAAIRDNGAYYNRVLWAKPGGELLTYDKRHLFRMAGEEKVYSPGASHLTVEINGWRIRPFVCYDLRFPVWTRNSGPDYDLAVFTANWPAARVSHWETLLCARAIENQCYVAGVNRTGLDGNGIQYNGRSSLIDYNGNAVFHSDDSECKTTLELSRSGLESYRNSFPAWKDSDKFQML